MRRNPDRLLELQRLAILDTAPDRVYDQIAQLAVRSFGVPIGMVNLLDEGRDWFKACVGLPMNESPADTSFCEVFFERPDDIVLVNDTLHDPRFAGHPLVVGAPHVRFYASARLTAGGHTIGTLCVYDTQPHEATRQQLHDLQMLASAAMQVLGRRHPAIGQPAVDPVSGAVPGAVASRQVVLVDDSADSSVTMAELLSLAAPHLSVEVHSDWDGALRSVLARPPWAVLADLKVRVDEGMASAARIRSACAGGVPRLVAVSANVNRLDALRGPQAFDRALAKPVEIGELLRTLEG